MLTETPHYELTEPMFISSRLMPAVHVGNGTLSAEAHAIEHGGRAHFRFYLDVPGVGEWTSTDSYVTTVGRDWTQAVAMALETFTDAAGSDDFDDNLIAGDLPGPLAAWMRDNYLDFMIEAETLREWLESRDG